MKLKLTLISILLGCVSSVHATLIDLTPGGFAWNNRAPVFERFLRDWNHQTTSIIAGANITGNVVDWSHFTLFGPDNFIIDPQGPSASVSWNLANTEGYWLQYIWVTGEGGDNQITNHLYRVGGLTRFEGDGSVIIDGFNAITNITFLGINNTIPDVGSTLLLFGLAIAAGSWLFKPTTN